MSPKLVFDPSRPPTSREVAALEARAGRLSEATASIEVANSRFDELLPATRNVDFLRLRTGYVFRSNTSSSASDLRLPPIEARPPATSLITPRGAALRFHLIALAEAQMRTRAGTSPRENIRPLVPRNSEVSWTDLMGSSATAAGGARRGPYLTSRDKRARQIRAALTALSHRRLVFLPNRDRGAGKHEGFILADETDSRPRNEEPIPYTVPGPKAGDTFSVPISFITQGWVHVLEDTEIAILLMVACGAGSIDANAVAIPSETRLLNYGIGRDAFEAHRWLQRFGLLDVQEIDRHDDGRAIDFGDQGASLHRLSLRPDGFNDDALDKVRGAIRSRAARAY